MTRFLATGLVLFVSSLASADDLPEAPVGCPAGSVGNTEHAGQWCAATACTTDADCTAQGLRRQVPGYYASEPTGLVCREVALCVVEEEYTVGGLHSGPPPTETRRVARGPCIEGACPSGGECGRSRRCAQPATDTDPAPAPAAASAAAPDPAPAPAPESDPDPGPEGGCAVGSGSPLPWWLTLVGITFVWGSRRR